MKKIFFTGVFLVTISVSSSQNVPNELQQSNLTANENGTATNETKKEKYNAYVDAKLQEVWEMFLAEAEMTDYKSFKGKHSAVTETIKAFRVRGNDTEEEAAANNTFTTKPGAPTFGIGNDRTPNVLRRQGKKKKMDRRNPFAAGIRDQMKNREVTQKFEGYGQPYWAGGDSVFLRTGSPGVTPPRDSTNPMEIFRGCDRTCNYYFKTYGRVCGHRYKMKTWQNEYRNFANICDIDHENCIIASSRPNWHPLYRGNCSELYAFPKLENDFMDIVARGKQLAAYAFTQPTPTQPTPGRL